MPLSPDLNTNTLMCFSASSFIHLSMYVEENIPFNKSCQSVSISNVDLDDLIWWLCILPCSIYILTFIKTAQVFMSTPAAWLIWERVLSIKPDICMRRYVATLITTVGLNTPIINTSELLTFIDFISMAGRPNIKG